MCKKGLISDKTNDSRNAQDSVDSNKEKLTIYYECGFKWQEKISAITNRGTITSDLIKLLESNGYAVRLVFYGLLKDSCDRETLALTINMKDFDEPMNEKKLNFPLKNPSFFRRLGFRTIETTNVSKIWSDGYGRSEDNYFEYFNIILEPNDMNIKSPSEMNIQGNCLATDAMNLLQLIYINSYNVTNREVENFVKTIYKR